MKIINKLTSTLKHAWVQNFNKNYRTWQKEDWDKIYLA